MFYLLRAILKVLSKIFVFFLLFITSYKLFADSLAVMRAIDRSTGRTFKLKIPINADTKFSNLLINVKYCYKNPIDKEVENYAYLIIKNLLIDENIFQGWMFSSSPSLSSLEHPIYDIWLLDCEKTN